MSDVFKTFSPDDIQVQRFKANKRYSLTLANFSASYEPDLPIPVGNELIVPKIYGLVAKADRFTEFNSGSENLNSAIRIPSRSVWDNLWHMYYRDWPKHGDVFCTNGDSREYRELYDTAYVISVPHYIYGEEIDERSVVVSFDSTPSGEEIVLKDDGYGNLYNSAYATSSGDYKDPSLPPVEGTVLYLPFKDLTPYQYRPDFGKGFLDQQILSGSIKDYGMFNTPVSSNRVKVVTGSYYGTGIEFTGMYGDSTTIPTGFDESTTLESWSFAKIDRDANNPDINFVENEDFAISFYLKVENQYDTDKLTNVILSHIIPADSGTFDTGQEQNGVVNGDTDTAYPFRIEIDNTTGYLHASRKDGSGLVRTCTIEEDITDGEWRHILFQKSGSRLDLYNNFNLSDGDTSIMSDTRAIRNENSIVLGSQVYSTNGDLDKRTNTRPRKLAVTRTFRGSIDEFRIYSGSFSTEQVNYLSSSSGTGINHWGNVFYEHGQIVLTHPSSAYTAKAPEAATVSFRATTRLQENLYSCEIKSNEYNQTLNPSTIENRKTNELFQFTSDDTWNPYITRIGLYNDAGELLVIGTLAQPMFKLPDYDMTFVVRFDT